MVYELVENQVPTENVPSVMKSVAVPLGVQLSNLPSRTTVEKMTLELGLLADYQAVDTMLASKHLTLGFDATTQQGNHWNSLHITTPEVCLLLDVHELPGGTALDYTNHITQTFETLAATYCNFTGMPLQRYS